MADHPYWAYMPDTTPDPRDPEEVAKAVNEGRRLAALDLAVRSLATVTGRISGLNYTNRAEIFEQYLKGEK